MLKNIKKINNNLNKFIYRYYIPKAEYKIKKDIFTKYFDKKKKDTINIRNVIPSLINETLGYASLNNTNNYNILNKKFMNDIINQFEHFDLNNTLKSFIFTSQDQQIFSLGTDYKRLYYLLKNSEIEKAKLYLEEISNFTEYVASYNKPFTTILSGLIKNSAVNIFTLNPFTYSDKYATFQINDIDYGFVPNGGNLYFLSRFNFEIGLFMALTGISATSGDLFKLNKIKGIKDIKNIDYDNLKIHNNRIYPFNVLEDKNLIENDKKTIQMELEKKLAHEFYFRTFEQGKKENMNLVLKELIYKKKILNHANLYNNYDWQSEFETLDLNDIRYVENNLLCYEKEVLDTYFSAEDEEIGNLNLKLYLLKDKISFHFCHNNIKDIMESLEKENSEWSLGILSILESKDNLMLQLTIDSLRAALNLDFISSLKLEQSINKNLWEKKEVFEKLNNKFENLDKDNNLVSIEKINFYLNKINEENNLKFKDFSLLPVKEYYEEFSESVRLFLNEQGTHNIDILNNYEQMVKYILFQYGIDMQNPAFDLHNIRKSLFNSKQLKRLGEYRINKINELIEDKRKYEYYKFERLNLINNISNEELKKLTDNLIAEIFEDYILERNNLIDSNSKIINDYLRNKEFDKIKKFLINQRMVLGINDYNKIKYYNKPFEINNHILEASNNRHEQLHTKKFLDNYKLEKNYNEKDLKDYLSGELKFEDSYNLKAKNENEIIIDKNKINSDDKYYDDLTFVKKQAEYFVYQGKIKYEENFRNNFTNDLVNILINNNEINKKDEDKVYKEIYNELFNTDYKYQNKIKDFKVLNQLKECLIKVNKNNLNKVKVHNKKEINENNEKIKNIFDEMKPYINIITDEKELKNIKNENKIEKLFFDDLIKKPKDFNIEEIEFYWNRFLNYINLNTELKNNLNLIFKSKNKTLLELNKILFTLFYINIKEFDIRNIYKIGENDENFLKYFNNYIKDNVEYDYFNFISNSIILNFSILSIKYLEKKYKLIKDKLNERRQKIDLKKILEELNIIDLKIKDLNQELNMLDKSFFNLIKIYNEYKNYTTLDGDLLFKQMNNYNNLIHSVKDSVVYNKNFTSIFNYLINLNDLKNEYENKFYEINNNFENFVKDKNILQTNNEFDSNSLKFELDKINNNDDEQIKNDPEKNFNLKFLEAGCFQSVNEINIIMKQIKDTPLTNLDSYYHDISELNLNIPAYFEKLDYRQNAKNWLEINLKNLLKKYFDERKKIEKELDNDSLIDFDLVLIKLLKPEILKDQLKSELYKELSISEAEKKIKDIKIIDEKDKVNQIDLIQDIGKPFLKNVKNKNSLKKLISLNIASNLENNEDLSSNDKELIEKHKLRLLNEAWLEPKEVDYETNNNIIYNNQQENIIIKKEKKDDFFDSDIKKYNNSFINSLNKLDKKHFNISDELKNNFNNYINTFEQ